jgi:putative ABC transport system permease protein
MKALDLKLLRDLWKMKGQVLAIALVITSGISAYVMLISNIHSLNLTREKFYAEYGFADVFASLKRAPEGLRSNLEEIPGVGIVETRVVAEVKLDIPDFNEPVTGKIVSLPDSSPPLLNRLFLRSGRMPAPWRDDEVLVNEAFAQAHRFRPGVRFGAVVNGRWKSLVVVGVALSPEFVLQVKPGALSPDYKRYAIIWMGRHALGTAYDMDGAFNDVCLTLTAGAKLDDVLARVDRILERYGGLGACGRKDQMSHRFLSEEFRQLENYARIFPTVFIAVAAFLLNVALSRTVSLQRDQTATLKAFGYSTRAVGIHYLKMVIVIVLIGVAGGLILGAWLGTKIGKIYMEFYRFPYLLYLLKPSVAISAMLVTLIAGVAGTLHAVRRAVSLPPAEAMRPEPPAGYGITLVERAGLGSLLSQPSRMVLRNIGRRPLKALLTVTGIALSCAIMVAGTFSKDAVDYLVDVQYRLSQREDMTVTFVEPASRKALFELKELRGITDAEGFRSVPVRLRFGHQSYRTSIQGVGPEGRLHRPLDTGLKQLQLPSEGIVLNDYLAGLLGVSPGESVTAEVLEGRRPTVRVPVVGLVRQYIGLQGFMDINALNRLMREGDLLSGAYITVDAQQQDRVYRKLVEMPRVAGAFVRQQEIRNFYDTQAEAMLFFTFLTTVLAGTISVGVVYNSARISLSERSRELASLRVLGYTRAEISYIFLAELALLTLAAIPLGLLLGEGLSVYISRAVSSDLFRVPPVLTPATRSLAAAVVVLSACISGLIVRHRLDHLDLVAVLKTKE